MSADSDDRSDRIELRGMAPRADMDESGFRALQFDILDAWLKGTSVQCVDWTNGEGDMHMIRAGQLGDITAPRASFPRSLARRP